MPSVLIIEDELPNVQRLEKMLLQLNKNIIVQGILQTVQDSILWLSNHEQPDLIFMDIRLTDGLSFEIFNHVEITAAVIFITAYDEYALKAFEVNGIDYLLKPLEVDKLKKSLEKASAIRSLPIDQSLLQLLKSMQLKKVIYRSRFLIPFRERYLLIKTDEIAYFTTESKVTFVITHDGQRLVIDQSLEILEAELDPEFFFRISRQYISSLGAIQKIHQSFNGQLKIELTPLLSDSISISRERSNQLKKWLDQSER